MTFPHDGDAPQGGDELHMRQASKADTAAFLADEAEVGRKIRTLFFTLLQRHPNAEATPTVAALDSVLVHCRRLAKLARPENGMPLGASTFQEYAAEAAWIAFRMQELIVKLDEPIRDADRRDPEAPA